MYLIYMYISLYISLLIKKFYMEYLRIWRIPCQYVFYITQLLYLFIGKF